ncbi:MAG: hypothetical protein A2X08_00435 [Bacteroidetes bacterium GWA2_32_17]|nr:MAG: hypothetical protein A2X08_00435 [Bacteroidetes bacterium GWA2_32_17]
MSKIFKNESPKPQDPSLKSQAPNLEFGIWSFILLLRYYRQALYSLKKSSFFLTFVKEKNY